MDTKTIRGLLVENSGFRSLYLSKTDALMLADQFEEMGDELRANLFREETLLFSVDFSPHQIPLVVRYAPYWAVNGFTVIYISAK